MKTSADITPDQRVKVQAAATNWLDHSCSSTVNFLRGSVEQDVEDVYLKAWKQGCEGITVYVDGSREGIVSLQGEKRDRPATINGVTHKYGEEDWVKYITVTKDERGMPIEVFVSNLSDSYEDQGHINEVITKLLTLAEAKKILSKFSKYGTELSPTKRLVIHTTILLRCSINISEILQCFENVIAGSLPFFVKLALRSNIPSNMQELGAEQIDPTCVKGNCG